MTPKTYAPREHPKYKEFAREHPNRDQIIRMLEHYHAEFVAPLVARIEVLEAPLWRRLWWRVTDWWNRLGG